MKGSEVRSRCALKDFSTTVRDDVFAPTPSPLSVRGLETIMQADSSCEMFARPPKGQERDGWIWTQPRLLRIPGWNTHRAHGFQTWQTGALSVCMSRTQHVWYLMWTTLLSVSSQRRLKNSGPTKLVVIKRREAISPRIPVTCLGFEYRRVHDGDRRGFTVKITGKYVDECLDIFQQQKAKAEKTPLTEQKSLNLHDETTASD